MFGKDQFANKLFVATKNKVREFRYTIFQRNYLSFLKYLNSLKEQLYNSNIHGNNSPELYGLRDQRAASDGAAYLQKELTEKKMSKTFTEDQKNFLSPVKNLTNIFAGARIG